MLVQLPLHICTYVVIVWPVQQDTRRPTHAETSCIHVLHTCMAMEACKGACRCYSAEEQDAPAALVKVTDLFGQEYMDMPAYNNPEEQMGARACALALHLNEEISLFRDFAEADGILTPRVHLVDDTRYATLG